MKYDYVKDVLRYNGKSYPLSDYRAWLIRNHESLCTNHFVKAIRSKGKTVFTFDWQSIFLRAEEYQFLNDYINESNSSSAQ
jgi:hypothetical protein